MNINILLEWLNKGYLSMNEIALILIEEACAAFHNDSYKLVIDTHLSDKHQTTIFAFGTLDITRTTNPTHVKQHIDYLKELFKCEHVETATDLLDTHNLFNGYEPKECIQVCDSSDLLSLTQMNSSVEFQMKLVERIKNSYLFLDDLNSSSSQTQNDSISYIHLLCVRVLNECVYLLNEVGIWCLAKSLLPFICQLDKLSSFIESTDKKQNFVNEVSLENEAFVQLDNPTTQQILILKYTSTLLRELREMCIKQFLAYRYHSATSNLNTFDYFLKNFTTPKVRSLINLLRSSITDEFCGLIFVQNKQVATSLSLLLKKLAKEDPSLGYLYPNYIIGPGSSSSSSKVEPEASGQTQTSDCFKQEEILRKFYSGEINLLLCTYEMEERIHSPNCVNLIVRFNCSVNSSNTNDSNGQGSSTTNCQDYLPFDYFSYISTKTRAKTKNSFCYFFIEKSHFDAFFRQFSKFKQIENILIKNYSSLIDLNKPLREFSIKEVKTSLSLENSVYFINKYCLRLPSDALTQLTPKAEIKTRESSGLIEFKCVLHLPINSGLRETIESEWETSSDLAKASASYNACLILYTRNEMTETLEPVTKEIFYRQKFKSDSDDEKEWSLFNSYFEKNVKQNENLNQQIANYMSHRPGGNKRKQIYRRKVSSYLKSLQLVTTQHPSYLYAVKCTLTTPLLANNSFDAKRNEWCFGLITSKLILEVVDFPIFTQNGEETVSIELVKSSFYLTPNQFRTIKIFHKFLFSNVLRMEGRGAMASPILLNFSSNSSSKSHDPSGTYICILNDKTNEFDWSLMSSIEDCTDRTFMKIPDYAKIVNEENQDQEQNAENEKIFEFDESKYSDSVVIPFYRNTDIQPQFYCVSSIDHTLSPLSPFPVSSHSKASNFETFFQYFSYKYNILITNHSQPLLIVTHPSTRLNLLTPRYMNMRASVLQKSYHQSLKSDKKSSSNQIFLVPELVNIHPLSASVWRRCLCLPSILHRLNSLLCAEELRRDIAKSTGVGVPWMNENQKFDKLSFEWDTLKEIEISNVPDQEMDIATIENEKKINNKKLESNSAKNAVEDSDESDPQWNFEISEWDNSCFKEAAKTASSNHKKNCFAKNDKNGFFSSLNGLGGVGGGIGSGWNEESKTLFIDPNDMNFLVKTCWIVIWRTIIMRMKPMKQIKRKQVKRMFLGIVCLIVMMMSLAMMSTRTGIKMRI